MDACHPSNEEGFMKPSNKHLLRGSGSYPTMIRARTANRKITKRSESVTLAGNRPSAAQFEKNKSPNAKKRKRMVYSKASRRKSLENLGLLVRNRCGTAKLHWPSEKKETDAFELLPEGCLKVRQLCLKSPSSGCSPGAEVYYEEVEQTREQEEGSSLSATCKNLPTPQGHPTLKESRRRFIDWKSRRNISVIVRIRPKHTKELDEKAIIFRTDANTIVFDPKEKTKDFYFQGVKQSTRNDFGRKRPNRNVSFQYDKVYGPENTNQEIFNNSLQNLTDHLIEGYNCTIFAYGATGSGKTYTMIGSQVNPGLTVLMVESLYKRIGELAKDYESDIVVSYLEVYNETIKDLLRPEKELSIREDGKKGIIIPELTFYKPRGPSELLKLLRSGNRARTQHATDLNSESSRSHAVFEVKVSLKKRKHFVPRDPLENQHQNHHQQPPLLAEDIDGGINKVEVIHSKLVMVDLAGSERGAAAGILDGVRQREGASINKSLLALANCISALADGKCHIPYRNSKLTRLLKDALSGNCTTVMIANISPSVITSEDTYNTLRYADRAKSIIGPGSKQNVFLEDLIEDNVKSQVAELQAKVVQLSELLEEEKLKHELMAAAAVVESSSQHSPTPLQGSKELGRMGGLLGEGDGLHTGRINVEIEPEFGGKFNVGYSPVNRISLDSSKLPNEMKTYIDIAHKRGRIFSSYVQLAHNAKLEEWMVLSKKLKIDMADYLGRLEVNDGNYVRFAKLKNDMGNLAETIGALNEEPTKSALELKHLSRKMELLWRDCKRRDFLSEDHPHSSSFPSQSQLERELQPKENEVRTSGKSTTSVAISLEEFFQFKQMLAEQEGIGQVEQFHHTFCEQINDQLMTSGMTLMHALKLLKSMYLQLQATNGLSSAIQGEYREVMDLVYGLGTSSSPPLSGNDDEVEVGGENCNNINNLNSLAASTSSSTLPVLGSNLGRRSSLVMEDLNNLRKLVERPLLAHLDSVEELEGNESGDKSSPVDCNRLENPGLSQGQVFTGKNYESPSTNESNRVGSSVETMYRRKRHSGDDPDNESTFATNANSRHQLVSRGETSLTADETSSRETLFERVFLPEAEYMMPWASTATATSILYENATDAAAAFPVVRHPTTENQCVIQSRKGTSFEIKFEKDELAVRKKSGQSRVNRFPVKSKPTVISTPSHVPAPLSKEIINEGNITNNNSSYITATSTTTMSSSSTSAENVKSRLQSGNIEREKILMSKTRLVDQPVIKDDHPYPRRKSTLLEMNRIEDDEDDDDQVNPSSYIYQLDNPSLSQVPSEKGFSPGVPINPRKSWGKVKSSRNPESQLVPSRISTNTTNPNPLRGRKIYSSYAGLGSNQPEIAFRKRNPPSCTTTRVSHQQQLNFSNNSVCSSKSVKPGRKSTISATPSLEYPMSQGHTTHHQLKVSSGRKKWNFPSGPSADLDVTQESQVVPHPPPEYDSTQPIISQTEDVHHQREISSSLSARSSVSHKTPYHTNSKTFTISRETLPMANIPVIPSLPKEHHHPGKAFSSNERFPPERIFRRQEETPSYQENPAWYTSHGGGEQEEEEEANFSDNNSSTASYSESS